MQFTVLSVSILHYDRPADRIGAGNCGLFDTPRLGSVSLPESSASALPHHWRPDRYLDGYELLTLPLGPDPDGEDPISATLVRKPGILSASSPGAVLYVHGYTDYFFQEELADFFHARGYPFYALDLRKCGRSYAAQQTPHYITDLAMYDEELDAALAVITGELAAAGAAERVLVAGHSTGGLITPLWLDRMRTTDPARHATISGLLVNSPWLDLQGERILRTSATAAVLSTVGRVRGKALVPRGMSAAYGESLHVDSHGEWSYDLDRKPLSGFPVTFGWMNAIRQGHLAVHRGIDAGVPVLSLRSDTTHFAGSYRAAVDTADCVLDVAQIAQWSPFLAHRVLSVAIPDARHDVFLSLPAPRAEAYRTVDAWLRSDIDTPVDEAAR